jgi:hypothetical protein
LNCPSTDEVCSFPWTYLSEPIIIKILKDWKWLRVGHYYVEPSQIGYQMCK